jgi:type IV secretion system protein VirB10
MFVESVTALMIASLAMGQAPVPATQRPPPTTESSPAQSAPAPSQIAPAGQNAPAPTAQAIIVPAGTAIQLTLMSAVKTKSTKAGDKVRAVVAFPVTIGTQLAIPAGTFVDGTVSEVMARPKGGQSPVLRIHFTGLVYSNGYSVALNGENTQALVLPADSIVPTDEVAELTPLRLPGARFAMGDGQGPPIGAPGIYGGGGGNPAIIAGIAAGAAAAFVIGTLIVAHHRTNKETDFVLYDSGWQFQMVLDSPVVLDAAHVAAAAQLNP